MACTSYEITSIYQLTRTIESKRGKQEMRLEECRDGLMSNLEVVENPMRIPMTRGLYS
jgi:hypothetical protein